MRSVIPGPSILITVRGAAAAVKPSPECHAAQQSELPTQSSLPVDLKKPEMRLQPQLHGKYKQRPRRIFAVNNAAVSTQAGRALAKLYRRGPAAAKVNAVCIAAKSARATQWPGGTRASGLRRKGKAQPAQGPTRTPWHLPPWMPLPQVAGEVDACSGPTWRRVCGHGRPNCRCRGAAARPTERCALRPRGGPGLEWPARVPHARCHHLAPACRLRPAFPGNLICRCRGGVADAFKVGGCARHREGRASGCGARPRKSGEALAPRRHEQRARRRGGVGPMGREACNPPGIEPDPAVSRPELASELARPGRVCPAWVGRLAGSHHVFLPRRPDIRMRLAPRMRRALEPAWQDGPLGAVGTG